LNENLDPFGERIKVFVPNMFGDISPADHFIRPPGEVFKERILLAREDQFSAPRVAFRARVSIDRSPMLMTAG
jgi:hypothetical protein